MSKVQGVPGQAPPHRRSRRRGRVNHACNGNGEFVLTVSVSTQHDMSVPATSTESIALFSPSVNQSPDTDSVLPAHITRRLLGWGPILAKI